MKQILLSIVAVMLCAGSCVAQDVKLPEPQKEGGKSVVESLWSRASGNEYSDRMLSEQDLSNLLFAAVGINRDNGKLTSPTAGNRQEIRLFVFTKQGVYEYLNTENILRHVVDGDHRILLLSFWTAKCRLQKFPRGAGALSKGQPCRGHCHRQWGQCPSLAERNSTF